MFPTSFSRFTRVWRPHWPCKRLASLRRKKRPEAVSRRLSLLHAFGNFSSVSGLSGPPRGVDRRSLGVPRTGMDPIDSDWLARLPQRMGQIWRRTRIEIRNHCTVHDKRSYSTEIQLKLQRTTNRRDTRLVNSIFLSLSS